MKSYVVGFIFSKDGLSTALIRKNRPAWQRGRLNGVGGHIEPGERVVTAMRRECEEETGVTIPEEAWDEIAVVYGDDFQIFYFRTFVEIATLLQMKSQTDEEVEIMSPNVSNLSMIVPNVRWMLSFALDPCVKIPIPLFDAKSNPNVGMEQYAEIPED
jgi:8-oxo-dGTP diphosphatase